MDRLVGRVSRGNTAAVPAAAVVVDSCYCLFSDNIIAPDDRSVVGCEGCSRNVVVVGAVCWRCYWCCRWSWGGILERSDVCL